MSKPISIAMWMVASIAVLPITDLHAEPRVSFGARLAGRARRTKKF